MNITPLIRTAEEVRREIESLLNSLGILCRVFGRAKTAASIRSKLENSPGKYHIHGKLIQDGIGVRVVVYFPEDIPIVEEVLKSAYDCDSAASTIDKPIADVFSVTRHNLIFQIPERLAKSLLHIQTSNPIDITFEVQLRTILSEGWHEIEHDLRYKRKSDWENNEDLSRHLNGVVATLETSEWSMRKIFDDLAYRHYSNQNWEAMLHSVLRMKTSPKLSPDLQVVFSTNLTLAKEAFRIKRPTIFRSLNKLAPKIPLTLDNIVYLWNFSTPKNQEIFKLTPDILLEIFNTNTQ
ncbi:MAG: hypothetical protein U1D25_08650 [Hydrogenophaga sp.]|uniref:hypothetical protein n=1 Tax=Hydrogenophaga sp. TaxID=1904254 RepID=UPI002ABA2320|nr:hypothetical protein [Hydrogenophaga sp.]MDZ4188159.1 hypothetical protein [Hydrogenophaga sp.]